MSTLLNSLDDAITQLKNGGMIILVDDEDRENEGDLVIAAEKVTADAINFMAIHARGLICLALDGERIDELKLPMMTSHNKAPRQTAFTVSIEAREGVTTGISAADRAQTILVATDLSKGSDDLVSPGHIFPLRAVEGGVLIRAGHTEGSVDLMKMAGLRTSSVICEIMKDDGTMARLPDLKIFAEKYNLPIISIQDIIARRMQKENLVVEIAKSKLPTEHGEFDLYIFKSVLDDVEHMALVKGPLKDPSLIRVHSECLTGDAIGSLRCDCGAQLQASLKQISEVGNGALIYIRSHEGRGIGLGNKIRAYALQDQGMDTVEANHHLGFKADLRHYGVGAQIIKQLGVSEIKLLTNNPKKLIGLAGYGLSIVERVSIDMEANTHNAFYLQTKKDKMGHMINGVNKK